MPNFDLSNIIYVALTASHTSTIFIIVLSAYAYYFLQSMSHWNSIINVIVKNLALKSSSLLGKLGASSFMLCKLMYIFCRLYLILNTLDKHMIRFYFERKNKMCLINHTVITRCGSLPTTNARRISRRWSGMVRIMGV